MVPTTRASVRVHSAPVTPGGLGNDDTTRQRRTIRIVTTGLVGLQVFLVLAGWLYRATLYWGLPVVPGEPFGLGDLVELLIGCALLGSSVLTLVVAIVFVVVRRLRHWGAIGMLACAGVLAVPLFLAVHPHVPQLVPAHRRYRAMKRGAQGPAEQGTGYGKPGIRTRGAALPRRPI